MRTGNRVSLRLREPAVDFGISRMKFRSLSQILQALLILLACSLGLRQDHGRLEEEVRAIGVPRIELMSVIEDAIGDFILF